MQKKSYQLDGITTVKITLQDRILICWSILIIAFEYISDMIKNDWMWYVNSSSRFFTHRSIKQFIIREKRETRIHEWRQKTNIYLHDKISRRNCTWKTVVIFYYYLLVGKIFPRFLISKRSSHRIHFFAKKNITVTWLLNAEQIRRVMVSHALRWHVITRT